MFEAIKLWFLTYKWVPFAALAIGFTIRALKDDTKLPTIPPRLRRWALVALGVASAVIEHKLAGVGWEKAIYDALAASIFAMLGHDVLIEGLRGGKEIPIPGLMKGDKSELPKILPLVLFLLASSFSAGCHLTRSQTATLIDLLANKTKCAIANMDLPNDQIIKICALQAEDIPKILDLVGEARTQAANEAAQAYARGREDETRESRRGSARVCTCAPLCPEPECPTPANDNHIPAPDATGTDGGR